MPTQNMLPLRTPDLHSRRDLPADTDSEITPATQPAHPQAWGGWIEFGYAAQSGFSCELVVVPYLFVFFATQRTSSLEFRAT